MRNLKRALSMLLSSTMVLGMVVMGSSAAGYADVTSENHQEAIEVLQAVGIMTGDQNGNFNPDQKVTRNQMAVIMANLMEYNVATYKDTSPFTDVPEWAEPYVAACYTNGITAGTSATTYGGEDTVTTAQAALMLMKALGYFQYQTDFGSDWQLATVKQANAIDLFNGVNSAVADPMTRNDVAQLVLNTLESGIVQAETNGSITVGDVTIATDVKYNYVTSNAGYAKSISAEKSTTNTTDATAAIVELGEDLYQGDLARDWDATDAFGRPADIWSYKDNEIGTYINERTSTWTGKVSERDLYRAAGTTAVDNYAWNIYVDGKLVDSTSRPNGYDLDRNDTNRWMKTGNGVLTEMFVDTVSETVNVTMINSYVAEVTRVEADADEGDYNVTVNYKTQPAGVAMDRQFNSETEFAQGDIVIVNAANGNIEAMTLAQTVEGTVDAVKANDYLKIGGTTYNYNYAYTTDTVLRNYTSTSKGLYDLKNSTPANPSAGDDVVVYLDAYGCAVAIADAGVVAEDYIYVKGVHYMYGDYSARVIHFDGTEEDVTIDKIDDSTTFTPSVTGNEYQDYTTTNKMGLGVYKYDGGSKYDLYTANSGITGEEFDADKMVNVKIENGRARIGEYNDTTKSYSGNNWAVDNNTVYVDVANNTSYTGYQNVPTMSNVEGWVVMDGTKDSVADVVFITNDDVRYEEDNDSYFVVTSSTPEESLLESDSRTRAAGTDTKWTYNVWVNGEATTLEASKELDLSIGVWKITGRDSNGLVTEVENVLTETAMIPFADFSNFNTYATYKTADSLTLNTIDSDKSTDTNKQKHFAITAESLVVVAQMNKDNDAIEDIVPGSLNDIQVADSTNPKDDTTSAVFVLNSKDDDFGTVAKLVLVINPEVDREGGGSSVSGVSDFTPVTESAGTATVRYYNLADSELQAYVENEMSAATGLAVKSYNTLSNKITMEDGTSYTIDLQEVFKVSDGENTTYVDKGTGNMAPGANKLPAGKYLLAGDEAGVAGDLVTVAANGNITDLSSITEDTNLVKAYLFNIGSTSVTNVKTKDGTAVSDGDYVAEGIQLTMTGSKTNSDDKFAALQATIDSEKSIVSEKTTLGTSATQTYTYTVNSAVTLTEVVVYDINILGNYYGYLPAGETVNFSSSVNKDSILLEKEDDSIAAATGTVAGDGPSERMYTVNKNDAEDDGVINLVEAYKITDQTTASLAFGTTTDCDDITEGTTYVKPGTKVFVKTSAADKKLTSTALTLTVEVEPTDSVNGIYYFTMPHNTIPADAITESAL